MTIEELKEALIEMLNEAEDEAMLYEDDNSFRLVQLQADTMPYKMLWI